MGRVHGHNAPCTRSRTRPIHSRVHVRLHGPCTRPHTRTVCRNGPHTAVACRMGTCTRPGRPTCRIHGPDGPCTRPSTRAVTRPCKTSEDGGVHGPYTAEYTSRYGPFTAVCTTRYTTVYGRVVGRFRQCRWPVHGRVHGPCTRRYVDTCTRPYTCRVHGRVHGPYMAVYTSYVRGRVLAMYMAEDVRTVMYTGGVDGPCAQPIHVCVCAVYTARPLYGRARAVFAVEDVFTCVRVTGTRHVTRPCTRPVRGRTTAVYTAVDGPYTDV